MHATQTIQLVTVLSQPIVDLVPLADLKARFTNSFWGLSKCREQRWKRALSELRPQLPDTIKIGNAWEQYTQLAEEIFVSEMLTRVWLAKIVNASADDEDVTAISNLIMDEHARLRNATLQLLDKLSYYEKANLEFTDKIRKLQANVMQSTDMFLAHMNDNPLAERFTFSEKLYLSLHQEAQTHEATSLVNIRQQIGDGVYSIIAPATTGVAYTADLNNQIVNCVSDCLLTELAV